MGVKKIDEELCTGCGICFDICPMDVFRMDEEKEKAYIAYPKDCAVCYQCEQMCPVKAIYVSPELSIEPIFPY